jgi:3-oxoadipate enol-lactonase
VCGRVPLRDTAHGLVSRKFLRKLHQEYVYKVLHNVTGAIRVHAHSPLVIKEAMSSTSTSQQYTTKSGTKTHYISQGPVTGSLIVLLHGLGGSTRTFEPLLPLLPSEAHQILTVDFEGFGRTPLTDPSKPLSIERYVADLDDLIGHVQGRRKCKKQGLPPGPVIFVGHSLGSIVALHYVAKRPSDVGGLALLCVGRSASHIPAVRDRMLALAATVRTKGISAAADIASSSNFPPGDETTADMRREVHQTVESSDPEAYAQMCEAMVSSSHQDPDYAAIICSVALISGADDTISPVSRAEGLAPLLGGNCTVDTVRGGHQPILSDLERSHHAIMKLIDAAILARKDG